MKLIRIVRVIAVFSCVMTLTACIGAVFTGADSVYNHYDVTQSLDNHWVELTAINMLNSQYYIRHNSNIAVSSVNQIVLLTGYARSDTIRQEAIQIVQNVAGVKQVVDAIVVSNPPPAQQALTDDWLTTKIKSRLFVYKDIDSKAIKVVTANNGIVFLMGVVPADMANEAVAIVQQTTGVRKVIPLFEIMTVTQRIHL